MHDKDQDRLRHSSSGNSCSVFFLSGSYFTAGVFIIEILLPVVLRFFYVLRRMEWSWKCIPALPAVSDRQ